MIRKLRAGVMPPPDLPRPALAEYDGLRDWLEAEIDRVSATKPNPGSVVLHRLNRTEYANVIRDLLDLRIDVTTLLPPDDSANGFDNIAGSLTLSPTLLESYTTAAARVARMAVGYWKSPTEATYLASSDASQNYRLDGMPFGTRGGIVAQHDFPADGEYKFSIQNFGIGSFIPGEQLALIIDGERAHVWPYRGVGLNVGMTAEARRHARGDGSRSSRFASRWRDVPRHQLPPESRHHPSLRSPVAREQHDPAAAVLPGDRIRPDSRAVQRAASARFGEPAEDLRVPPVAARCRKRPARDRS